MAHTPDRSRRLLIGGASLVALVAATVVGVVLLRGPPPVPIRIDGTPVLVDEGTTFGGLLRGRALEARNGRMLDVEGEILERRHDPGVILLNGTEPTSRTLPLSEGDRIEVVDGRDETEDVIRTSFRLDDPQPLNPARTLATARSLQVTVKGQLSGKLVRTWTKPIGPTSTPNAVALTFDDGPWPVHTAKILSILKRYHVKATFFVVGAFAERYPMLVRREHAMGMTVGNHSWSHPYNPPFTTLPATRLDRELVDTNALLERLGVRNDLFRPPGGSWDDALRDRALDEGMRLVLWDIDTRDWSTRTSTKEVVRTVLSRVRPGSIILMHDGGGDAATTIAALPDIIKGIRKRGLSFATL
ncbi:MAG: polysaccharide deacetylase family protein [Actinomycetota bacterium]